MERSLTTIVAGLAAVMAVACGSSGGTPDEELGGLVVAEEVAEVKPIDTARVATDRAELLRAVSMPHRRVGELLGGHIYRGTSKVTVEESGEIVEELSETHRIEFRDDGQFYLLNENSADYGRQIYFTGGQLYLAPRYSKFNKRPPNSDDEPLQLRDQAFAPLAAQLELVAHAAELSGRGGTQVGGRDGTKVLLALAPSPGKPPVQKQAHKKWRESIAVKALTGEIVVDTETGAPLSGKFEATVAFSRDGRSFEMAIAVTHELEAIGQNPTIEPPPADQVVVIADHHREAEEREQLLHGIAPPARKAPTPENTDTGKGKGK